MVSPHALRPAALHSCSKFAVPSVTPSVVELEGASTRRALRAILSRLLSTCVHSLAYLLHLLTLTLNDNVITAFGDAIAELEGLGISQEAALGDVQYVTDDGEPRAPDDSNVIPMHGGSGQNGVFNVVFLAIHPFQDGNGRLSRVLTNLMLLRAGYAHVSSCSLESVVE